MADYAGKVVDGGQYAGRVVQPELTAPSGESVPIVQGREAPMGARFGAGIKMTPEGQLGYYESKFGKGNVLNTDKGIYIIDPKTKQAYPADSPDFTASDVADFSGEALQIAPTLLAGSNPWTVGAATGAGNVVRQGVSALMPGDDAMSIGDRVASTAVDTALGVGTQFGVNKVLDAVNVARPKNITARFLQAAERKPFANIGRAVENEAGVTMTPGQRTGSRTLLTAEGMLRRNPATSDIMFSSDLAQLDKSLGYLNRTMERFSSRPADAASLGDSVSAAVTKATEDAMKVRSRMAAVDFGKVDQLAGGKSVIPVDATLSTLDDLIGRYDVPGGGDATASLVARLRRVREEIAGKPITASQMQRLLEVYGKAAKGKGTIFNEIDKGQQRGIAGKVFSSLNDDLDAAANAAANDNAGAALKFARDRYRHNSTAVNEITDSAIARLLGSRTGETPELVAERVLKMPDSQLSTLFKVSKNADPELAGQVKRAWIERAIEKGGISRGDAPPVATPDGTELWSPKKVATSLRDSPMWGQLDQGERQNMNFVMQLLDRLADRAGTDGSPTAPLQQAWELVKAGVDGAAWPFLSALGARKLARALTDPAGQKALAQISMIGNGARVPARAIAYFGTLLATDQATDQLVSQPPQMPQQPVTPR